MYPLALVLASFVFMSNLWAKDESCEQRFLGLAVKAYELTLKNTVNDYRDAVIAPKSSVPYRLVRRFFFAPRVREKDPQKRAEALKKVQWLSTLNEPVFDGAIEVASQLKMRGEKMLGKEVRPFERNLSIPGGIALSVTTGYGTIPFLVEKVQEHYLPSAEKTLEEWEGLDKLGSRYLSAWEKMGVLSTDQKIRAHNFQVSALQAWGENLNSKNPHRPLPPRLYQLRLEGMLKSSEEVSILETIALRSLQEAQKASAKNPKLREDQETKRFILEALSQHPAFQDRGLLEKQLLSMVFDPPIFLDGMVSNLWYDELLDGERTLYQDRRKSSDTYWLTQLVKNQKDPVLAKIRGEFLKDPKSWDAPLFITYAALNFSPEAKPQLPKLREALLKHVIGQDAEIGSP